MQTAIVLDLLEMEAATATRTRVFQPDTLVSRNDSIEIYSVEMTDEYTRVDFVAWADPSLSNGGSFMIDKNIVLRPAGFSQKMPLLRALHIDFAPMKHYFKGRYDQHRFSLFFPALERRVMAFDLLAAKGELAMEGIMVRGGYTAA
jgi:hypothetical protein